MSTDLQDKILKEFRKRLKLVCKKVNFKLTLFGSRARGDAEPESDIDIFVEIDAETIDTETRKQFSDIASEVSLEYGVVISLVLMDRKLVQERKDFPFLKSIRQYGIIL